MAFWGVEVKPGKPYTHATDESRVRLRITQAVIGNGSSTKRSVLQCNVGNRSPIFLCSLIPNQTESCGLDLEFEEEDDVVISVIGPRSIHLSGYYSGYRNAGSEDDIDSYGEDIADTETDESGSFDNKEDEYEDDFIDDGDIEMFESTPSLDSPRPNNGVIIEEIIEEEKLGNGANIRSSKKNKVHDSDDDCNSADDRNSGRQIVAKRNRALVVESEDEDGFPIFPLDKHKNSEESDDSVKDVGHTNSAQEKLNGERNAVSDATVPDLEKQTEERDQSLPEKHDGVKTKKKEKHKKKKKIRVENGKVASVENISSDKPKDGAIRDQDECNVKEADAANHKVVGLKEEQDHEEAVAATRHRGNSDKKKKKKKKRTKEEASFEGEGTLMVENGGIDGRNAEDRVTKKIKKSKKAAAMDNGSGQNDTIEQTVAVSESKEQGVLQPQQTRTFPNGMIVEELQMGKPDGKKATSGKKVSVNYVGKLKDGKIFDSNVRQRPFTFRLGVGQVIKGWDVGVSGMRIGDKRRLTIPPSMGYGSKGVGKIPPNSWLIFDVELVDAK